MVGRRTDHSILGQLPAADIDSFIFLEREDADNEDPPSNDGIAVGRLVETCSASTSLCICWEAAISSTTCLILIIPRAARSIDISVVVVRAPVLLPIRADPSIVQVPGARGSDTHAARHNRYAGIRGGGDQRGTKGRGFRRRRCHRSAAGVLQLLPSAAPARSGGDC